MGFVERNVSSHPETSCTDESGDGEGIASIDEKRVERRVEKLSEHWMNSSSLRDLWNNDVWNQRPRLCP